MLLKIQKRLLRNMQIPLAKNQNIKNESVKRNERISVIDKEIESWKNLLSNSEKMVDELSERKNKLEFTIGKIRQSTKITS